MDIRMKKITISKAGSSKAKIALAALAIVILAAAGCYFFFRTTVPKVSMSVILQETKEIDKLYTGVYIIPAIDVNYGTLKRDKPKEFLHKTLGLFSEADQVVKGYCTKRYEVAVGYDNVMALLSDKEIIARACSNKVDELPDPEILAANSHHNKVEGDYDGGGLCYRWDQNEDLRKAKILEEMRRNNIIGQVNKRGRESLKTLASIFCE